MNNVPALDKMDLIINYLYSNPNSTQVNIHNNLKIPKATLNRILKSLIYYNYLSYSNRRYSIGNKFLLLSKAENKSEILKNISKKYLENLSLNFKETFKLSILESKKVRTICSVESNDILKVSVNENAVFPLHAGAASKLLICQLPLKTIKELIGSSPYKYTKNTITSLEDLANELDNINYQKFASDNEEYLDGIRAIAYPIFNKKNIIIGAVSCPYFKTRFSKEKINLLSEEMKKSCNLISDEIRKLDSIFI